MKNAVRVIVVLVVAFALFVQLRPDHFHVERSAIINASSDSVFARIDDFHQWAAWSPWEKLDPKMQKTFEGPASGLGAIYRWSGNQKAGSGSMEITRSIPGRQIDIDLQFLAPMKASNVTTFTLAQEGTGTKVTWAMEGRSNFIAKAMCIFLNMDKMIGPDFERGLASLKSLAESAPAAGTSTVADTTKPATPAALGVK